jgi:hypothetical protein
MPTLAACTAAGLALVVAVGLQAPAVSTGLRWEPAPRTRKFIELQLEPLELIPLAARDLGPDTSWPSWVRWAVAALVTLAILMAVARWIRHRMRRAAEITVARTGAAAGSPSEADARIVRSGLAAALEILHSDRSSSDAVVQAWQGLEDAAAAAGLDRRPAETASEFTARILYRSRGSAAPIAVLLSLYQRVRFGHHAPSAAEITAARDSLATLVDLWQSDLPERRASTGVR